MSWRAITEDDLKTVLAGPELAAYRAAALASGQADPVAEQVTSVTDLVRGYIAGWTANTLGPDGTIPLKLMQVALDILAVKIPSRCAGIDPTDVRSRAMATAMSILKDVSRGTFKLDVPDTFSTETIAVVKPTISTPCVNGSPGRRFTRNTEDGA